MESIGRWLVIVGISIVVLGAVVWVFGRFVGGNTLPGTLRFDIPGGQCVIPILGSILFSIILTVIINIAARLINR